MEDAFYIRIDLWISAVVVSLVVIISVAVATVAQTRSLQQQARSKRQSKGEESHPPLVKTRASKDLELTQAQLVQLVAEAVSGVLRQQGEPGLAEWQQGRAEIENWGTDD